MRIIIGTDGVQKSTVGYKAAFGNIAFPNDHLLCVGRYIIRVHIQVSNNAVDLN